MYIGKGNGPKTEPWGTPILIVLASDTNPLIETNWLLLDRYKLNHSVAFPLIPSWYSFFKSILWSILSKASRRSINTPQAKLFLSRTWRIDSVTSAWLLEWNPNWRS